MATTDTNRAAFVKQEYRYVNSIDATIKARNIAARSVECPSNMDEASAVALAAKYLAENIQPRVFEITFQGLLSIDAFIGGPPRYIPNFPRLQTDGREMKVISASVDYDANKTVVRVRG